MAMQGVHATIDPAYVEKIQKQREDKSSEK
jgi:hypothetical protein